MVTVSFRISEKLQKQLIAKGEDASKIQHREFSSKAILDLEHTKVEPDGTAKLDLVNSSPRHILTFKKENTAEKSIWLNDGRYNPPQRKIAIVVKVGEQHAFEVLPSEFDILALFEVPDFSAEIAENQKEYDAEFEAEMKIWNERKKEAAKQAAEKAKLEAAEAKKQARIESERTDWIEKHGSERLKAMLEAGYELRMTYEQERLAVDFPDAFFDTDDIQYNDRANPSLEALKREKELKEKGCEAWIIWIIKEPQDAWEDEIEPYEAIAIETDWSRRTILEPVS